MVSGLRFDPVSFDVTHDYLEGGFVAGKQGLYARDPVSAVVAGIGKAVAVGAKALAVSGAATAAASGLSAALQTAQRNRAANAQIEALERNQQINEQNRQRRLASERLAALDFSRRASVERGQLLAQRASLGGLGGTSDLLSALATTQNTQAEAENLQAQSIFSGYAARQQEMQLQQQALADSRQSVFGAALMGAAGGFLSARAAMPSTVKPNSLMAGPAPPPLEPPAPKGRKAFDASSIGMY